MATTIFTSLQVSKKECGGMKYVVVLLGNERTEGIIS